MSVSDAEVRARLWRMERVVARVRTLSHDNDCRHWIQILGGQRGECDCGLADVESDMDSIRLDVLLGREP